MRIICSAWGTRCLPVMNSGHALLQLLTDGAQRLPLADRVVTSGVSLTAASALSAATVNGVVVLSAPLLGVGGLTILPPLSSQAGAYLADRNIGLGVLLLVLLALGWTRCLAALLLMTAVVHAVGSAADLYLHELPAAIDQSSLG